MYQRYAKGAQGAAFGSFLEEQLDHCGGKKIINDFCVIEKIAQTLRLITPASPRGPYFKMEAAVCMGF